MRRLGASLPILCYHSIAPAERLGADLFERHLCALARSGLPSLAAEDLDRAPRGFLLTFDDGFADLWTHGSALLSKFGMKAVVFAIPSRAGEGDPRPQGTAAWSGTQGEAHGEASCTPGPHPAFLRWSELGALEATGAVTVQSHSFSHAAGWIGDEVIGFHLGGGRSHWSLRQVTGGDDRLGIPLYRRGAALGHRLFHDAPGLRDRLAGWLAQRGGEEYVAGRGAKAVERELWEELGRCRGGAGQWESEDIRRARTEEEIVRARDALTVRLGGRRDELCLPWGEYDEVTLECARRAGVRRVYSLDRGANPAGRVGWLVNRFEPRPKGPFWLSSRLWVYRSVWRSKIYGYLQR